MGGGRKFIFSWRQQMVGKQTHLEQVLCAQAACTEVQLDMALSCFDLGSTRVYLCSITPGRSLSGRCWSLSEWRQSHEVLLCCTSWWQAVQAGTVSGRAQSPEQWIWQDQANVVQLQWGAEGRSQTHHPAPGVWTHLHTSPLTALPD